MPYLPFYLPSNGFSLLRRIIYRFNKNKGLERLKMRFSVYCPGLLLSVWVSGEGKGLLFGGSGGSGAPPLQKSKPKPLTGVASGTRYLLRSYDARRGQSL